MKAILQLIYIQFHLSNHSLVESFTFVYYHVVQLEHFQFQFIHNTYFKNFLIGFNEW